MATICMILGSRNSPFTIHGYFGYSALVVMLVELIRIWRLYNKAGMNAEVPKGLHLYSRYGYAWWVIAYITGSLIAMT